MLNLVHVRAFIAVIDCGTFGDAARQLGCSQPTVSQQILKLEKALQTNLVVRRRLQCRATSDGEYFLPYARGLLRAAERARASLGRRSVTVGASSNVGVYLLQPHLRTFQTVCGDDVHVDIWMGTNPEVADRLRDHEIDVAVMEWWDDRLGATATLWRREPLVIIVPPDHPWASRTSVRKDQFLETPLIGGESGSGTGRILGEVLGPHAERLRVGLQLPNTEAVKQAVKAGLGISVVLASAVVDEVRAGSLRALSLAGAELHKDIYVVRQADHPPGALGPRFVEHLVGR